jgi:DNA primase
MSSAYTDAKERVKNAIDIVELVRDYVEIRREGRGYKALCPWHDDTKPSLQINPDRQSFKCWVCDIGGDVFTFVEKIEGVEFREALRMLAERAGISLSQRPDRGSSDLTDKRVLLKAMDWAMQRFHECLLRAPEAEGARNYLRERGISGESVRGFHLGYAPDEWDWILRQGREASLSPLLLERIGLVVAKKNGPGYYDRFKGRVLFPIIDPLGRAVALGGRILPGSEQQDAAKYINSPETPLFTKNKMLYGLDLAREAIRKSGEALVMEGYTDCIVAHQFGFNHAVAVLGTALGAEHISLLRRMSERLKIVLLLDGDEAGRKRANEVLELFLAANADLRVLTLPDNLDPCEYLQQHGADSLAAQIAAASDALAHAFNTATEGIDLQNDIHAATSALERLLAVLAKAPRLRSDTTKDDRLREEKFLQRLAFSFRMPEEQLRSRLTQLRKGTREPATNVPLASDAATPPSALELELLELILLLNDATRLDELATHILPSQLKHGVVRAIYEKVLRWHAEKSLPTFERLLLEFDAPQVKTILITADELGREKANKTEVATWHKDILARFKHVANEPLSQQQHAALHERSLPMDQQLALLRDIEQQARTRHGLTKPTDGLGHDD